MIEFLVLGRTLRADLELQGHWANWLRTHWFYPQHALPERKFTISLRQLRSAPALKTGDWTTLELMEFSVPARFFDNAVTFGDARAGAELRVNGDAATILFWGATSGLGAMLHALISESLRASGLLSLHASAGVRSGQVTAFLGASGAGKTTTLLRAWRAGWQPICEDLLWLEVDTLQVFGWDRGLRLLPDTVERFKATLPALQSGETQTDKWFVPYAALSFEPVGGNLARLALLGRGETTHWRAASRLETALALWQATGLPLTATSQTQVATAIASLTGRLEATHLVLGREDFSPLPAVASPLDNETTA